MNADSNRPTFTRRRFLGAAGGLFAMLGLGGVGAALPAGNLLRPPGGQDEGSFISKCLKCDRCRSVCPTGVIGLANAEDGFLAARTPVMKFHDGECIFCHKCTEVCSAGALAPYATEEITFNDQSALVPEDVVIGIAVVHKDRCIAWTHAICEYCKDVCPYEALSRDEQDRPVVDETKCNGCGICEYVCPLLSLRSYLGGTTRGIEVLPTEEVEAL